MRGVRGLATIGAVITLAGCAASSSRPPLVQPCRSESWNNNGGPKSDGDKLSHRTQTPSLDPEALRSARRFVVAVRTNAASRGNPDAPARANVTDASPAARHSGTGVVIDRRGLILTNEHVIAGATHIDIHVAGVGWLAAEAVGSDRYRDLAVLRVDRELENSASLCDAAELSIGHSVTAIGYASGCDPTTEPTTASGLLTATASSLQAELDPSQERRYSGLLESSAAIPRGFSGGPMIDARGRVIGINAAAADDPRTGRRLGYAIPMTPHLRAVVATLSEGRTPRHACLGLGAQQTHGGPAIATVRPAGPAQQAGLRYGDMILKVNHKGVPSVPALSRILDDASVDKPLVLTIRRGERTMDVTVIPAARQPA